ncbi:MAG: sulfatase [Verrucomicrobia bacterium]|nr:MAG: sulfatase [Verrucomicrobiota bacterium]
MPTICSRRDFLKLSGLGLLSVAGNAVARTEKDSRPNVLVIITDQQHAGMLSCTGNPWVKTPNLDRLAGTGVRFEKAYCGNPVCVPSRFTMFSGTMPSVIGMDSNKGAGRPVSAGILQNAMGAIFKRAEYRAVYGGKTHLPGAGKHHGEAEAYGFETLAPNVAEGREELAEACVKFFQQKQERPFLLVASFINPHDICFMAITADKPAASKKKNKSQPVQCLEAALQMPAGVSEKDFFAKYCPPVPANFEIPQDEPEALTHLDWRPFRAYVRQHWTEQDWRRHRWAYARLTELVDAQIGRVLEALKQAGLEEHTLVVFTSDHGDMDSAHRLEHKSMPYEEAMHVPFIVRWPGVTLRGAVDREHLVSTGLDLIPTLCDFAGIAIPAELKGCSVRKLAEGSTVEDWRKTLVIENENSRILHMGRNKYVVYAQGKQREQFMDLDKDPGEMKNLASDPAYKNQVEQGRRALQEWYSAHGLKLDPQYIVTD